MCLTVTIRALGLDRTEADQVAASFTNRDLLRVEVGQSKGLQEDPVLLLSEEGGCACSLLADDADWDAETWSMEEHAARRLAGTLEELGRTLKGTVVVEALWNGDGPEEVADLSWPELVSLARRSRLSTATSYSVGGREGID